MKSILLVFLISSISQAAPLKFDDQDLNRLMNSTRDSGPGLVYSWSPHMHLSVKGLDDLAEHRIQTPLKIEVALDANADEKLAASIVKAHKWPEAYLRKLNSKQLSEMGVQTHFPSYIFMSHGKIASPLIPGYERPHNLDQLAQWYTK